MILKKAWKRSRFALLFVIISVLLVTATGCIKGVTEVGWAGGTVADDTLFIGSREGRLVSINLETQGVQRAEQLQSTQSTGLFGCNPYSGCSSSSSAVAIYGAPVVVGDMVYMAGYNGRVYAYEKTNISTRRWVYPIDGNLEPIVANLVVEDNRLFFGDTDGNFYCLDALTGEELWNAHTDDRIWGTATVSGDVVYIGSFDKNLYAFNVSDGTIKWTFEADGAIVSKPLVHNGVVYFGVLNKTFYALNENDASIRWSFSEVENWFWASPVIVDGKLYVPNLDGNVYILAASTGSLVTKFDLGAGISSSLVVVDTMVVAVNREGGVYSINSQESAIKNLENLDITVNGGLSAHDGIVYLQTDSGQIVRIEAATGSVLQPLVITN